MSDLIEVNEIFGPTFQGEGPAAGQHALFVRLARCNLECVWCDTPYTWAFTTVKIEKHRSVTANGGAPYDETANVHPMSADDIMDKLNDLWPLYNTPTNIVISGGEPMMQQSKLVPLVKFLKEYGNEVHIETAGTIRPLPTFDQYVDQYVVSPKLTNSGNRFGKRYKYDVLRWFALEGSDNTFFKFVVGEPSDLLEVEEIVNNVGIDQQRVMIMPEGTTSEVILFNARRIEEYVRRLGYGLSLRNHVLLWGDKRGV